MQIVTNKQVKYCNLVTQILGGLQHLPGISFQGKFFIKKKIYLAGQEKAAVDYCREKYLNSKGKTAYLLVEDNTGYTIWVEDKLAKIVGYDDQMTKVNAINLEELVARMRSVGGVKIKDRNYRLRTYKQCFVGSEACDYLRKLLNFSEDQAILLGQRLIDKGWIHHVVDEQQFKNEALYYRFYWDEGS